MQEILYKVPGGKLLRIFLEQADGQIRTVKITGDFFAHPEEHLVELEKALQGATLEEKALQERIENFLHEHPTEIYGFTVTDLVTILTNARN